MTTPDDPRFAAAADLLGRSGADHFEIRYCDGHDEDAGKPPVVWIAIAHWPERPGLIPDHYELTAGLSPWRAVFRLCEATMDGGTCVHCGRPSMVDDKPADDVLRAIGEVVCAYRYDPELKTFRRDCEGRA